MIILGIDPGYERLGIAIVSKNDGEKETLIFSECFKTSPKTPHNERLSELGQNLERVIEKYNPEVLTIEALFFNSNQKTVMMVSEARGTILYVATKMGLKIFEYGPGQIKAAVTGYGRGDKNAVIRMIPLLIKIDKEIKHDDEYDAIAVALTHLACHH